MLERQPPTTTTTTTQTHDTYTTGTLLYPNGKNHSQTFDVQLGDFEVGNSHMAINQLNYVIHNITSLETLTFSKIVARNVLSQVTGKTPTASEGQLLESVLDLSLMINEDEGHRFGYGKFTCPPRNGKR